MSNAYRAYPKTSGQLKKLRLSFWKHLKSHCTCEACHISKTCDCAYDIYNANGDCLASK